MAHRGFDARSAEPVTANAVTGAAANKAAASRRRLWGRTRRSAASRLAPTPDIKVTLLPDTTGPPLETSLARKPTPKD